MTESNKRPLNGEVILVVDDEELVRDSIGLLLAENGAEILIAGDGADALEVLRSTPQVTCALVDYSMPGMNGHQVYLTIEKERPGLPVVIISGLSIVNEVSELHEAGKIVFLPKPFGEVDLLTAIKRAKSLVPQADSL